VKKRISPAKKCYDEKHPVISFRDSKGVRDRLRNVLEKQDKSIGQFIREAIEIEERNYKEALRRGYRDGLDEGRRRYAVLVPCIACASDTVIDDEKTKAELWEEVQRGEYFNLCMDCDPPDFTEGWEIRRRRFIP
jgi:hypothetical protein